MNSDHLPPEITPPPALERRTIDALRAAGLLRVGWQRRLLPVAALLLVSFAAGWLVRGLPTASHPAGEIASPRFALLLYGDSLAGSEAERVAEYRQWAGRLASEGHAVSGEKLSDAASVAGPEVPASALLRGFFIISAASETDARQIAASHPHVRRGGSVVVRPIAP